LTPSWFHTPTFEEQGKAVVALGNSRNEEAVEALIRLLSHRDKYMRVLVINSLDKIGSGAACRALHRSLEDEDPDVRVAAKLAINRISQMDTCID